MEPRFGHDFSQVRVHTDARAAESAQAVGALAYTVGRNVVFGAGQYAPGMYSGRQLLAHELTHVLQQPGGSSLQSRLRVDTEKNSYDSEADLIAQRVMDTNAKGAPRISSAPETVQRACGRAAINEPVGCIPTESDVSGFRYLFNVNCDEFASGNEEDLRIDARLIKSGETVEIHGLASMDGDPTFNLNLSCARALRAKEVVEAVLAERGVSATILVFNHGATEGDATQQRSVVVSRIAPEPPEPKHTVCGPDATDWLIRQVNAAKADATILALQARLEGAERVARRFGFSAEAIAVGAVARKVLAEEARVGSPARTPEARSQLAASVPGQQAFARALLAATVPLVGAPEAFVLAAIRGAALTWKGLVETGAKYDFKNDSRTMKSPTSEHCPVDCAETITLCPSTASDCFIIDVPGNLFYAHVGRFVGWTELALQLGSQFAQLDSSATWDSPEDTRMISLGFALPDPLSRSDLCAAINANRSIFKLQECANCDEEATAEVV
jgi:outer membrane protein OmpA-like peptidoglycan-associated protein